MHARMRKSRALLLGCWIRERATGCSDSTYSSRAADADNACTSYGNACESWSKDDKLVDRAAMEDAMKKSAKCVEAVEKLDSDCLPRTSSRRDQQFGRGKKAHDVCKDLLDFKKERKLCK